MIAPRRSTAARGSMRVLLVNGSPREGSNTGAVLDLVAERLALPPAFDAGRLELRTRRLELCNGWSSAGGWPPAWPSDGRAPPPRVEPPPHAAISRVPRHAARRAAAAHAPRPPLHRPAGGPRRRLGP